MVTLVRLEAITERLLNYGFTYVSGYVTRESNIVALCKCGTEFKGGFRALSTGQHHGCKSCRAENNRKRVSGENNPMHGKTGNLNPAYKDGLSNEKRRLRRTDKRLQAWSYAVKDMADFSCDCCSKKSNGDMVAHHLHNYNDNPELRLEVSNGVCLCVYCHINFHIKYGVSKNTPDQYYKFKNAPDNLDRKVSYFGKETTAKLSHAGSSNGNFKPFQFNNGDGWENTSLTRAEFAKEYGGGNSLIGKHIKSGKLVHHGALKGYSFKLQEKV